MYRLLSSLFVVVLLLAAVNSTTFNDENDYTKTWVVASSYNDSSCGINLLSATAFQSGVCVFLSGSEWVRYKWDGTLITGDVCTDSACTSCTSGTIGKGQCNLVNGSYVEFSVTIGLPPISSSLQSAAFYSGANCSGLVGMVTLNPTSNCQEGTCAQLSNAVSAAYFCGFPTFDSNSTYIPPAPTKPPGGGSVSNDLTKHWLVVGNFNSSKCNTNQMVMGHAYQIEVCTMNTPTQYVMYTTQNQTNGIAMLTCTDSACTQCGNATKIQLNKCNSTIDGSGYSAYFTSWGLPAVSAKATNLAIYDRASCVGVVSAVLIYPGVCNTQACYSLGNGRSASGSCGYPSFAAGSTYGNVTNPGQGGDINGFNSVNDFSKFWIVVSQYNDSKCSSNAFLMGNAYQIGVCAQKNATSYVKYSYDSTALTTTRLTCIDAQCKFCDPPSQPIMNQCSPSTYGGYVSFTYSQGLPAIGATVQTTAIYSGSECGGAVNMVTMTAMPSGQVCEAYDACTVGYNQSSTYSCGFPHFPLGSTFIPDTTDEIAYNEVNDMTKAWLVVENFNDSKCTDQFIHGKAFQIGVCSITSQNQYVRYSYDGANVISEVCADSKCGNCAPYQLPLGTCAGATNGFSTYFFSQGLPTRASKMASAAIYNGASCDGIVSSVEYEPISATVNCSATTCATSDNSQSISYFCGYPSFAVNSTFVPPANSTDGATTATTAATSASTASTAATTAASSTTGSTSTTGSVTTTTTVTIVVKMTGDATKVDVDPIESAIAASLGVDKSSVSAKVSLTDPSSKRTDQTFYLIVTVKYSGLLSTPVATLQSEVATSINSTTVQQAFSNQNVSVQNVAAVSTSTSTEAPTDAPTSAPSGSSDPTSAPTTGPTSAPDKIGSTGFAVTPSLVIALLVVVASLL